MHPLKRSWVLWAHYPRDPNWDESSYLEICTMKTMEEVISVMLTLPSQSICAGMYFIMRKGIFPKWEDPANASGGAFSYRVTHKLVAQTWRELAYMVMGESITSSQKLNHNITGITVSPKNNSSVIKVWVSDCTIQEPTLISNEVKGLSSNGCMFKRHIPLGTTPSIVATYPINNKKGQ